MASLGNHDPTPILPDNWVKLGLGFHIREEKYAIRACLLTHFSSVRLCATLWTVASQAPLSMEFSRCEYWSGLPCPTPGDLPNPEIEPAPLTSPDWQVGSLLPEPPGKPKDMPQSAAIAPSRRKKQGNHRNMQGSGIFRNQGHQIPQELWLFPSVGSHLGGSAVEAKIPASNAPLEYMVILLS